MWLSCLLDPGQIHLYQVPTQIKFLATPPIAEFYKRVTLVTFYGISLATFC